ncbi:WhiB family transcriptional regulator [Kitasatospora sp. NPDC089797]|uniref:WhiB family transcriptional regulator n=1 Tax=Kitasatospora sp. NPDC089797 TaxID=3155298 RepID=UPI00342E2F86
MPAESRLSQAPERPWHRKPEGACRATECTALFRPSREPGAAAKERVEAAKAVCAGCRVRVECRRHALAAREPHGVWGGLAEEERRALFTTDPSPHAGDPWGA